MIGALRGIVRKGFAISAALACAFCANAAIAADDGEPEKTYPAIEYLWENEIGADLFFKSDDPDNELLDVFLESALGITVHLTPALRGNIGLKLESVLDPDPGTDRFFGDLGLYAEALNVEAEFGGFTITIGKYGPGFGIGWDVVPGVYGTDFAEDYELAEMIGIGIAYKLVTEAAGTHTFGVNAFMVDRTVLSDSLFTSRGRTTKADGGAGNTGTLNNFSFTLDGEEIPDLPGLSYHIALRYLSAGMGDPGDETGAAFGLQKEMKLGDDKTVTFVGEIAFFNNFGGSLDDAFYLTGGIGAKRGSWHGEVAATLRHISFAGGGHQDDYLAQASLGYEFDNGVDVSAGYAFTHDATVDTHVIGLRIAKAFEGTLGQ